MAIELAALSESTLTERYQTTIPEPVRKFLGLIKRTSFREAVIFRREKGILSLP
jgi:antitoxin PrlF